MPGILTAGTSTARQLRIDVTPDDEQPDRLAPDELVFTVAHFEKVSHCFYLLLLDHVPQSFCFAIASLFLRILLLLINTEPATHIWNSIYDQSQGSMTTSVYLLSFKISVSFVSIKRL